MRPLRLNELMPLALSFPRTAAYWLVVLVIPLIVTFVALDMEHQVTMRDPLWLMVFEQSDALMVWLWSWLWDHFPLVLIPLFFLGPRLMIWFGWRDGGTPSSATDDLDVRRYWWFELPNLLDMTPLGLVWRYEQNRPLAWTICLVELPWTLVTLVFNPRRTKRWFIQDTDPLMHTSRDLVRTTMVRMLESDEIYSDHRTTLVTLASDLRRANPWRAASIIARTQAAESKR